VIGIIKNSIKRFWWFWLILTIFNCASTSVKGGTGLSLSEAIKQSAEKIASKLPQGSRIAIAAFESENNSLTDYIMEELTGELFDRGFEVADRQNLAYVYQELNFQMSGNVSDETAKYIGKFLAADMVITGSLTSHDDMYRFWTRAIRVETAVITGET